MLFIIVLARPKTQAVIPLPQLKANFSLTFMSWFKNIFSNSSFFLKVLSSELIIFENGRFFDPLTFPFLKLFLGSSTKPLNLFSPLASIKQNSLFSMFFST